MKLPNDFIFSQSNLQNYVNCHYSFYLQYVLQLQWPALLTDDNYRFEEYMIRGARFHRLVHQYFLGIPLEALDKTVQADPDPNIEGWWQNFIKFSSKLPKGTYLPEYTLFSSINGEMIEAKYDLLVFQDNFVTIFDWKTNQKLLSKSYLENQLQTRVYLFVLASEINKIAPEIDIDPAKINMTYWQAEYPDTPLSFPYSKEALNMDKKHLSLLIEGILDVPESEIIRTSDLRRCRFCNYRSLCDRGIKAGRFDDIDSVLVDLASIDLDLDQIREIHF